MASEIDICNLALAHLGDNATVASIDPPEGSAQAEHCARFYPMARDALLELHSWKFATRRATLAQLENAWAQWDYAYAKPADCLRVIGVIPADMSDDLLVEGVEQTQNFTVEIGDSLNEVILTDQADAVVRYIARQTDASKFPPLFIMALAHQLAAMMAGPVLKGDVGAAEAKRQAQFAQAYLQQAIVADASQRKVRPEHKVGWIAGR